MGFFHSSYLLWPVPTLWREFPGSPRVPPQQPRLGRHQQPGRTQGKCHPGWRPSCPGAVLLLVLLSPGDALSPWPLPAPPGVVAAWVWLQHSHLLHWVLKELLSSCGDLSSKEEGRAEGCTQTGYPTSNKLEAGLKVSAAIPGDRGLDLQLVVVCSVVPGGHKL